MPDLTKIPTLVKQFLPPTTSCLEAPRDIKTERPRFTRKSIGCISVFGHPTVATSDWRRRRGALQWCTY